MLGPILCGLLTQAPLLPKLRGHFAEFLGNASPAGLGVLPPPTCVGLRYGCMRRNSGFSWHGISTLRYFLPLRVAPLHRAAVFLAALLLRLRRYFLPRLVPPPCVPTVLGACSTGISTCCPSATPFGLALGPDLPRADQLYPGNLGYSADRIPTYLSLLIPASSLPGPPPPLTVRLRRASNAPLPRRWLHSPSFPGFGGVFQPRTFSAQGLSTSELLRTL